MHIHILGICGTFMGGIARLAIEQGHRVTGSDQNCYPPMSDQLEALGISLHQGYDAEQLTNFDPDLVVVGNAMTRGMPVIEALLNSTRPYTSGPQWLGEHILRDKWVLAVAGTHGKTTTSSMIAWILEEAGFNPGYLIGGVPENFSVSARLTDSVFFVVEADEYDTAFFDKRSKFVHYHAKTCVLNNLEFDHADIFSDLAAIETQFHHLVRTLPACGQIIRPQKSEPLDRVIARGCWSELLTFGDDIRSDWSAKPLTPDCSAAQISYRGQAIQELHWSLIGQHNLHNALAAIAACHHAGVQPELAIAALSEFKNVKRRMELKAEVGGVSVYDDFAHHPTAIKTTLAGLRQKCQGQRIVAVLDIRSNTMKRGDHKARITEALAEADLKMVHLPQSALWDATTVAKDIAVFSEPDAILKALSGQLRVGDQVVIMSNGGFGGLHQKLINQLKAEL